MKIEKSVEFLDFLLEPLGITMLCSEHLDFLMFIGINETKGDEIWTCKMDGCQLGGNISVSVDEAFDNLFNGIDKFVNCNNKHPIRNPYIGCQSLEEALIRRDLLRTKNNA